MSSRAVFFPAALLVFGAAFTAVAVWALHSAEERVQRTSFERAAEQSIDDAELRLRRPIYALGGLRGAAAASGRALPTLDDVSRYVAARDLASEFPGVGGIGVIVPVPREAKAAFEAKVRSEGDPEFAVRTAGDAEPLFVIKTIEPRMMNAAAVGFDVGSEPLRRVAAERVMRDGMPTVTGPITLLQDARQRPAALLMAPIFASGRPERAGPDDPVAAIAYAAVVYEDLMTGTRRESASYVALDIVDRSGVAPVVVHRNGNDASTPHAGLRVSRQIDYFGRRFDIEAHATSAFIATHPLGDWRLALLAGLLLSLMAAVAARQQVQMRARAEALAATMTRDLERLAAVARLTKNAVVITDPEGRVEWSNPAFRTLTGYSDDEMLGRKPGELLQTSATDPVEIAKISEALERRVGYAGVLLNRSKAGREYHIEIEIQPITGQDGQHKGFVGVQADISEQLNSEAKLKASESLLDRTGELSGVGGWRLDLASEQLTWTRITRRIHELPDDYVPTLADGLAFYPPEARPIITAAVERGMREGVGWDVELPFVTAKGRRRWVRAVGQPEIADGKLVALIGAFADITSAVDERERLDMERRRLDMILQGTGAGTWEWNVQTGETRFNERWAEIIGYRLDELAPVSIATWMDHAHPDDLERSGELLEQHFAGERPNYSCEARMRHREGHWVWVLDRGRVMTWTPDGKPEWMFGTHLDITERKQSEIRLAESEALLSTTLHSIGDAVVTADAEGRITWINPVAEALTGWSSEEATGRIAADVLQLEIDGRDGRAPCPIRSCLDEGRKVGLAGNTTLVSRGGARYIIEDSAAPLRERNGRLIGVVMVFHDVTEKATLASEMNFRATHDTLTGLVNRAEFEAELQRTLERTRSEGRPGALMFLDLDHFKMVNDACGHAAGDRLLVQVAALMRNEVRGRDVVARFGGDEFAIILEDCPLTQGEKIAQKIVDAVEAYRYIGEDGRRFRVGVSIGLVPIDARWLNLSQIVQSVDAACYVAKSEGRGRVVVDEGIHEIAAVVHKDVQWGPLIEQALDEDLFQLFGQRVVPLRSEAQPKLRCEVLLRMIGPDGVVHGPGQFIPAAERYQLASRIDRWVLRHVLDAVAGRPLGTLARIAVNLSGQSVGDRAFHRFALDAIRDSGIPPDRLCIEVTETSVVTNLADAARFIDELHQLGVQVALDDFGAGSASFGYLRSLKVDVLKIDGQFVRGLLQGELETAAVRSFIDVARVLDLRTVAEQIESETVANRLTQLGVDFGQGYFFHRPEPLEQLLAAWCTEAPNVVAPLFTASKRRPPAL